MSEHYIDYTVRVWSYGDKIWKVDGDLHREDGPAVDREDGNQLWYRHGKLHREDGPAIEYSTGTKHYYVHGVNLTEEEFNNRNKSSCDGKVVTIDGKEYELKEVR